MRSGEKLHGYNAKSAAVPDLLAKSRKIVRYAALYPELLDTHQLKNGGNRLLTVLLYLNDVDYGGWTQFPHIMANIVPNAGSGILFRNTDAQNRQLRESLHAGLPVTNGEKWIACIWIRENPYITPSADLVDQVVRRKL